MTRTDRNRIVPRVPAPRLAPDDWFVEQLSQLAASSTPTARGLLSARARRALAIAIASAALLTGGAYAAHRVTESSPQPGDHVPRPIDVPVERATPTADRTPGAPDTADPEGSVAEQGGQLEGDRRPRTEQGGSDDSQTDKGLLQPTEAPDDHSDDSSEDSDDTGEESAESDPDSEAESDSDNKDRAPSPSPSPELDADIDDLLDDDAPAPDALEES